MKREKTPKCERQRKEMETLKGRGKREECDVIALVFVSKGERTKEGMKIFFFSRFRDCAKDGGIWKSKGTKGEEKEKEWKNLNVVKDKEQS